MKNNKTEKIKNIETLKSIRDDAGNLPAVRMQAIQTMQKLISEDDAETKKNIEILKEIRDGDTVSSSVKVQAIQTMHKIFELIDGDTDDQPSEADIMAKIRKTRK